MEYNSANYGGALAANGNSPGIDIRDRVNDIFHLFAWGTWGAGSLQLQVSPDQGTTWVNVGAALTANGFVQVQIRGTQLRVVLSGATAPNLNWTIFARN